MVSTASTAVPFTGETILRNSVQHPNIEQHDVQVLLWAIVARATIAHSSTWTSCCSMLGCCTELRRMVSPVKGTAVDAVETILHGVAQDGLHRVHRGPLHRRVQVAAAARERRVRAGVQAVALRVEL